MAASWPQGALLAGFLAAVSTTAECTLLCCVSQSVIASNLPRIDAALHPTGTLRQVHARKGIPRHKKAFKKVDLLQGGSATKLLHAEFNAKIAF
jgi:hypothetical protein